MDASLKAAMKNKDVSVGCRHSVGPLRWADSYPNKRDEFLTRVLVRAVERQWRPNKKKKIQSIHHEDMKRDKMQIGNLIDSMWNQSYKQNQLWQD